MEFLSATKLIQDALCPHRRKFEEFEDSDHLKFGKAVDAGITAWLRGGDFDETFATIAGSLNLPLNLEYLQRADKCFKTLQSADTDWLKLNRENIVCIQSDDGEAEYYGNKFFEVAVGKDWGLRGAKDFVDRFALDENGERIDDLYDFGAIKKHVIRIIDWKTGWSDADDLQTATYALAGWIKYEYLRQIYDEQGIETVIQTRFFYLDQGGKSPKRYWNRHNLVSAFNYIAARVKAFRARKDFPRQLNKLCYCCSLADKCPVYQGALAKAPEVMGIEATPENLPAIIKQHDKINAILKIVKKAEKDLNNARKDLLLPLGREGYQCGDRIYLATESSSSYNYDLPSIFEGVQNLIERPPYELMKFDSQAYDDLIAATDDAVVKKALKQLKIDHRTPAGTKITITSKISDTQTETESEEEQIDAPVKQIEMTAAVIQPEPPAETEPAAEPEAVAQETTQNKESRETAASSKAQLVCYYCPQCQKLINDYLGLNFCPNCEHSPIAAFQSLQEGQKFLIIKTNKDEHVFECAACNFWDFSVSVPGDCPECGAPGPWRVLRKSEV